MSDILENNVFYMLEFFLLPFVYSTPLSNPTTFAIYTHPVSGKPKIVYEKRKNLPFLRNSIVFMKQQHRTGYFSERKKKPTGSSFIFVFLLSNRMVWLYAISHRLNKHAKHKFVYKRNILSHGKCLIVQVERKNSLEKNMLFSILLLLLLLVPFIVHCFRYAKWIAHLCRRGR